NVGAGFLRQGPNAPNVRAVGVFGRGQDPLERVVGRTRSPRVAARYLREQEQLRVNEVREVVVTSVNNVPVRVRDLVGGGPGEEGAFSDEGVFVGHQPRLGKVSISRPQLNARGEEVRGPDGTPVWDDEEDKVMGVVLMRKGEATLLTLRAVKDQVDELNSPDR